MTNATNPAELRAALETLAKRWERNDDKATAAARENGPLAGEFQAEAYAYATCARQLRSLLKDTPTHD